MTKADNVVVRVLLCLIIVSVSFTWLTSCSPSDNPGSLDISLQESPEMTDTIVTIRFGGIPSDDDSNVNVGTRGSVSESATRLDLWIFEGDTETTAVHQSSSDAGFGSVSLSLDRTKTYTLHAIAHKADAAATLTDGVISFPDDKVKDSFYGSVTFSPATSTTVSCELHRIVAQFRISTTDAVPATAKKIRITQKDVFDRWSITDGATHQLDRISTINISSTNADGTAIFNVYSIVSSTETLHDITVEALTASDEVIQTHVFPNVPLRNGYRTIYNGEFFTATAMSLSFSTDDWTEYDAVTY